LYIAAASTTTLVTIYNLSLRYVFFPQWTTISQLPKLVLVVTARCNNARIRLILNGWFTSNPDSWPPSSCIDPLFISFHVSDVVFGGCPNAGPNAMRPPVDVLLRDDLLPYYKKYEPIGCRDLTTRERFRKKGISSYFSACLTLTLRRWMPGRDGHICFVDPLCDEQELLSSMPPRLRDKVIRMTHKFDAGDMDAEARLREARKLLEYYQTALLVVTSRLHCALRCRAFGTPVLFTPPTKDRKRLPGLVELMSPFASRAISRCDVWNDIPLIQLLGRGTRAN
jgi:hypothetical protein